MPFEHKKYGSITQEIVLQHIREIKPEQEFDFLFPGKTEELAKEIAWLYSTLHIIIDNPEQDRISNQQFYSALITWKATTTLMAAIEVFRRGYATEAITLLRNAIEMIATVLHMTKDPSLHDKILKGTHDPTDSITPAKDFIPVIGPLYGALCSFAHAKKISSFPGYIEGPARGEIGLLVGGGFDEAQKSFYTFLLHDIEFILQTMRSAVEVVFHSFIIDLKYWKTEGNSLESVVPQDLKEKIARFEAEFKDVVQP